MSATILPNYTFYHDSNQKFQRMIKIMRDGCGREYCFCRFCKSHPDSIKINKRELSLKAREYLQEQIQLCDELLIPKSLQYPEIKEFEDLYTAKRDFIDCFKERILQVFGSYESLNISFVKNYPSISTITDNSSQIDFEGVHHLFKLFEKIKDDSKFVTDAYKNLLKDGLKTTFSQYKDLLKMKKITEIGQIRFICILLELPVIFDYDFNTVFVSLLKFILDLEPTLKQGIIRWFSKYNKKDFMKLLGHFKALISEQILANTNDINYLQNLILFTKVLFESNKLTHIVSHEEFYIETIAEEDDPREEYARWLDNKFDDADEFTFIDYPWILDCAFKAKILQEESKYEMEREIREDVMTLIEENILQSTDEALHALQNIYFKMQVRRDHIIEDTMNQIAKIDVNFKKPMKVKFQGEQGVDEGGVKKEFFQLLSKELLTCDFGMFTSKGENNELLWFKPDSFEVPLNFELTGMLLALAIYNSVNLEAKFPIVIYKKLLDQPLCLRDIQEFDPHVYSGLKHILEFDGDLESALCMTFQVSYDVYGETKYHNLIPGGDEIFVTQQNKRKYVQLYLDWLLNKSIEKQFRPFYRGFHKVVSGDAIRLFIGEELMTLICGSPHLDFHELEKVAFYEDGYTETTQVIKHFWEAVHEMNGEEQKRFLMFCTGSDRAPIKGLGSMVFVISRNGPDSDTLPSAHTCFNHLLLPEYETKEKLKQKLLQAIENFAGFGLC